jgi:hypothetical protein
MRIAHGAKRIDCKCKGAGLLIGHSLRRYTDESYGHKGKSPAKGAKSVSVHRIEYGVYVYRQRYFPAKAKYPRIVVGNPAAVFGNPATVFGNPATVAGYNAAVAGYNVTVAG